MQFEKIDLNDYNATGIFQSLIRVFRQISGCDVRRAGLVLLVLLGWCLVSSGARADAGGLSGQDIAIYKQAFAAVSKDRWAEAGIKVVVRSGDCLAPRYLGDAIFDGHRIAREIESENPERPRAIIRERQIWGHEVFPKLGDRVL